MVKGLFIIAVIYIVSMIIFANIADNDEEPELLANAQTRFLIVSSADLLEMILPGNNLKSLIGKKDNKNPDSLDIEKQENTAEIFNKENMESLRKAIKIRQTLDSNNDEIIENSDKTKKNEASKEGYGINQRSEFNRLLENIE